MKKIHLILFVLLAFVALACTNGVASAIALDTKYVGNTMVDLSWDEYGDTDFSKYVIYRYRGGSLIATITNITNRSLTFYRDIGVTKGNTYGYEIRVYGATGVLKETRRTRATTGEVHGTITQDTTWTAANSPYTLTGDLLRIYDGATLTIAGGVLVSSNNIPQYLSDIRVQKNGTLNADDSRFCNVTISVSDSHADIKNCSFEFKRNIRLDNSNDSVITNNTDCGSVIVSHSSNNKITGNTARRIQLTSSNNNSIRNNTVSNPKDYGIYLSRSSDNVITNNTVSNSSLYGIYLQFSSNNVVRGNKVSNNQKYGISLRSSNINAITGNNVSYNRLRGISLSCSSDNNTITGNNVSNNEGGGISLLYDPIWDVTANNSNNTITNNTVSNNKDNGIYLYKSNNNTFINNTICNNTRNGFYFTGSYNNTVTNNTVAENTLSGIYLHYAHNSTISKNTVRDNQQNGIKVKGSTINTLMSNKVNNSADYGIFLNKSSNNTIYNNYFNNTNNSYDNGNNTWNITKTRGMNIVDGPYRGGNYWSDYDGTDLDGDRLGDTLLPYNCSGGIKNGGDWHPLIKSIISVSASPEELPANGTSKSLITAIVANQTGPIVGIDVSFSLDNTSLGTLEPLTAKTNDSGIATSNFTAGTIPGVVNVTAKESKANSSDSVKIILGIVEINHTSSTSKFIPTPCRNATINFEIKPALLRDNPETNVSMIIRDKNSKLVYNSSEDQNAQINKTTAIWTGKNTTGVHADPRLSNYTVEIIVKYRTMTVNDTYNNVTVLPNKVIVVVDEERMKALYNANDVDNLMTDLTDYCCRNNGTLFNLTKVRYDFNANPGSRPAFTYRFQHKWRFYPNFVERELGNVTKFMTQNNNVSILLVGNDMVIPFHRKTPPVANWEDKYTFVPGNVMWTDYPYSDLNPQDWRPDVALGRLIGDPDLMRSTLANAITQYRSNTALIASCALGLAETQNVGNKFNTTWGFESQNVFKYYEMAGRDDIADITEDGLSFLQRLDGGHTIIYTVNHGNDFREDPGNAVHRFSDHAMKCPNAAGNRFPCCCEPPPSTTCYWSHDCAGKVLRPPFKPYKAFLRASNVTNLNGHPFYATIACHGGVTCPDDTVNTNMPLAFLNGSAVGYLGSTAYTPYAGLDFFSPLFDNMRVKNPTGESIKLAKRSMIDAHNDDSHKVVNLAMHLYGDPLYTVYVPNDPEEPNGYNISIEDDIIKAVIITYNLTTVETAKGDRNLIVIPGADLVSHPMEYVVPEIVVKMSLSPEYDINELDIAAHDKTTIANIKLPLTNPGAIHFIDYGYLGDKMDLPGLYPDKFAEFDVFEDPNGDKNVVFRIFPFQYNENSNEIYLYKNITLSYTTKPAEPKPPVRLSVTNDFESEITAGASTVVGMFIDNYGTGDAKNVNITEEIPDGFNVTFVSNGGTFNTATNIITWEIQSIGYEDFKMLNYELVAPQTVGNYTINTTIEYTDENGTVYPVINISKSIIVSDVAQPDLTLTRDDIRVIFNENATVSATIHNIGTVDASNIVVQFFDGDPDAGGTQIGTDQIITRIAHISTGTAQVTWTAIPGTHDIFVRVDPYDSIQEANENNNQAHKPITIEQTYNQPPIASSTYSPLNPIANETIMFNATNSYDPDGFIVNYEWEFGDDIAATGKIVENFEKPL